MGFETVFALQKCQFGRFALWHMALLQVQPASHPGIVHQSGKLRSGEPVSSYLYVFFHSIPVLQIMLLCFQP